MSQAAGKVPVRAILKSRYTYPDACVLGAELLERTRDIFIVADRIVMSQPVPPPSPPAQTDPLLPSLTLLIVLSIRREPRCDSSQSGSCEL